MRRLSRSEPRTGRWSRSAGVQRRRTFQLPSTQFAAVTTVIPVAGQRTARSDPPTSNNLSTADVPTLFFSVAAQPDPMNGLETALHILRRGGQHHPDLSQSHGSSVAIRQITELFANRMQFICSSIQAGSRLGVPESAGCGAQYLAPVLDADTRSPPPYCPFGVNLSARRGMPKRSRISKTGAPTERLQGTRPSPGSSGCGTPTRTATPRPVDVDRACKASGRRQITAGLMTPGLACERLARGPNSSPFKPKPANPAVPPKRLRREPDHAAHRVAGSTPIQPPERGTEVIRDRSPRRMGGSRSGTQWRWSGPLTQGWDRRRREMKGVA